jgi:hydroxymethylbilane synthase
VAEGRLDAVVVAAAGLRRLGRADRIAELLDPTIFTPAIGQGILAIQARADDRELIGRLQPLHDPTTHACALAERAVAVAVGAGCQTPVGAYAHVEGDEVVITAVLAGEGRELMRSQARGPLAEAPRVGAEAGAALLESRHA